MGGGASLNVMKGMILRGWCTHYPEGFTLRDMYLSVGVFVGRATLEGLTHRNKYLTVDFLVGILFKCIISLYKKNTKGLFTYYIMNKGEGVCK